MRLWHYKLLPYLPEAQFKGQLRELVAIMHDWRDKGETNHILINRVMDYEKAELTEYFLYYSLTYRSRYGKGLSSKHYIEFANFATPDMREEYQPIFPGWHDKEYLRVCMANLYEKHKFGQGKSAVTDDEWRWLLYGYRLITGEEYVI